MTEKEQINQISEWCYDEPNGSWHFKNDTVSIHVSFWQHQRIRDAFLAALRWTYEDQSYGTHAKFLNTREESESQESLETLLTSASAFVSNWLLEQQKDDTTADA